MSSKLLAYVEKESWSCGDEPGILRTEWRLRPLSDYDFEYLAKFWGRGWDRHNPGAKFVLEERYIRCGVEEPWTPSDLETDAKTALTGILNGRPGAVIVDPRFTHIPAERERAKEDARLKEEADRRREDEAENLRRARARSQDAFAKLMASKDKAVGEAWNDFTREHSDDEAFKARFMADEKAMELYRAAQDSVTVPTKRSTIKAFLKYATTLEGKNRSKGLGSLGVSRTARCSGARQHLGDIKAELKACERSRRSCSRLRSELREARRGVTQVCPRKKVR